MSNNKFKILIIEDDQNITEFLTALFEAGGYQVITADTCAKAKFMCPSHMPDLVILDLGLPDADGMEFLNFIRLSSSVPVIVLSARSDESDKVTALDMGANDYVTKPFGSAELMARVKAALRNVRTAVAPEGKFTTDDLTIDYGARTVFVGDTEVKLTQTEFNIVAFLSYHSGKVMTYSAIIKEIWGYPDVGSRKKLQVNMANIRKKLGSTPGDSKYIVNELGVGYRMLS